MASSPKPPLSDEAPLAGSGPADGDLHAWMVQYGPALRRYFLRRAAPADADDLVQEVFLALKARGSDEIVNVEGYLFRTASNVLARRHERMGWAWGSQEDLEVAEGFADDISPERIVMARQMLSLILEAMDELPARSAEAFFLYRFEQLSQEAVAKRMGISVKGVEALMRRALRHLVDRVGPQL